MSGTTIVITVVVALAVIALALVLALAFRNRRSRGLRERFGPEYDRAVEETGDRQRAERLLAERVERHRDLDLHELEPAARGRYIEEWRVVQLRFVDDPGGAVGEADDLVASLMRELGYPTESFEQQVADVSVEHADAVPSYRRAHELATARGQAATDDLRRAMVHYRELFENLLGTPAWQPNGGVATSPGSGESAVERPVAESPGTTPEPPAGEPPAGETRADERPVETRKEAR